MSTKLCRVCGHKIIQGSIVCGPICAQKLWQEQKLKDSEQLFEEICDQVLLNEKQRDRLWLNWQMHIVPRL